MAETSTDDQNLQNVQDRLMKMLDSVRLDPNAPSEAPPRQSDESPTGKKPSTPSKKNSDKNCCPSCDNPEPWGDSSWCPSCGYCPKLKQKIVRNEPSELADDDEEDGEEDGELSLIAMTWMVPKWIFWLSGGLLLLLIESIAIRCLILDIVTRSHIAILQILIGVHVFGVAHIRSYMIATHDNENLNLISIFWAPFTIWKTTLERMPSVSKTVCFGSWGLAAVLFAVLFIGLDYDNLFTPENFRRGSSGNPLKMIVSTMTRSATTNGATMGSGGNSSGSLEDALKDFAGEPDSGGQQQSGGTSTASDQDFTEEYAGSEGEPQSGPVVIHSTVPLSNKKMHKKEYFVFGFLTNSAGELRSILLAEKLEDNKGVRFSGKYNISLKDDPFLSKFRTSLNHHRIHRPVMKTIYNANWTSPALICSIAHNGVTPDGRFRGGQIVSFYDQAEK